VGFWHALTFHLSVVCWFALRNERVVDNLPRWRLPVFLLVTMGLQLCIGVVDKKGIGCRNVSSLELASVCGLAQ
jgi:hypothetical protein